MLAEPDSCPMSRSSSQEGGLIDPESDPDSARSAEPVGRLSDRQKPLRRSEDRWLDKWLETTSDLARLQYSHPMVDAVIDEIDGRMIRVGDQWLADFASCNYLGLDLDRSVIEAIPSYLDRWGTHPSWSRLLG